MFNEDDAGSVRVPKASELVASRVRRAIATGELADGDALPSETALMDKFKVSRPTARETIRILESEGLIRVGRGARGGARVTMPNFSNVAKTAGLALQTRGVTLSELYEGRMLIEPPAARLAAERRPEEAAAVLRPYVQREVELLEAGRSSPVVVAGFHRLLMEACGNGTLAIVSLALHDVFERALVTASQHLEPISAADRIGQLRKGVASHGKLVDLIEAGEGEAAEGHWRLHMQNASRVWFKLIGARAVIDVCS